MTDMSRPKKRSVLKMSDLAKLAGVSKSTVSRALAGSTLVNKETRDLIESLAREHNYRLNTQARNFRLKESLTIAVLIPTAYKAKWQISDPFFLELLGGIAVALNERGHELLLAKATSTSGDWIEDFVNYRGSDGVILIGQGLQHQRINKLVGDYSPLAVWGGQLPDQKYCTVGSDNLLGGRKATEHLISRGCERIAFVGNTQMPEVGLRFEGYRMALEKAGIAFDQELQVSTGFSSEAGFEATMSLLSSGTDFDGIFATSDVFAMGAIRALHEQGREVPDDVLVVGYDDISLSPYYNPPLTTVRQDRMMGGRLLVDNLFRSIEGGQPNSVLLPTDLVVRKSSERST